MPLPPISKSRRDWKVVPNLQDSEQARAAFSWDQARHELNGLPGGQGLNIAYEAVDRHADGPHGDRVAIRWIGKTGSPRDFSYAQLQDLSNRFANVLRQLGVGKADRVFVLLLTEVTLTELPEEKREGARAGGLPEE
jgi:acetyl-CoA synthetase